jgi:hypothetical protein
MAVVKTTSAPIKRGIVRHARSDALLKTALIGGIHERFAPEKVKYPFMVYDIVAAPYASLWGSRVIVTLVDLVVFAENGVDANNVDQLIFNVFDGAQITVDGQTTLICRRVSDIPGGPDIDSEGKKIYQIGGSYEIWTDQPSE